MRLKPVLPTLREKKRYVAFEVQAEKSLPLDQVRSGIEKTMKAFLGDLGMARAGVLFLNDWKNQRGILKASTRSVYEVKAALALVENIADHKAVVRSLAVSGTVDKLRRTYF